MKNKSRNRDFILLCQGSIFSNFGAVLYSAAVAYWVYQQTGSTSLMGILSTITYLIQVIAGPFAGSLSDYLRRRNVLIITDLFRGVLFIFLGILALQGKMNIAQVVIAAALSGLCTSLFSPASQSLTPDILDEGSLIKGQAIISGSSTIISLIGTAISGTLLVSIGAEKMILINGICYLLSGISECFIYNYPSHHEEKAEISSVLDNFRESLIYFWNNKGLKIIASAAIFVNLLMSGFFNLLLPYALDNGMSTQQYGYLGAFISAGSLIGTLLLSVMNLKKFKLMKVMTYCFLISVSLTAAAIYISSFYLTSFLFLIAFIFNSIGNGILLGSLTLLVPKEKRGAFSGLFITVTTLGVALSNLVYGILGDYIDLRILGSAGNLLGIIPVLAMFAPEVSELDISQE